MISIQYLIRHSFKKIYCQLFHKILIFDHFFYDEQLFFTNYNVFLHYLIEKISK